MQQSDRENWVLGIDVPGSLSSQPGVTTGRELTQQNMKEWREEKKIELWHFLRPLLKIKELTSLYSVNYGHNYNLLLIQSLITVEYLGPLNWCCISAFWFFFLNTVLPQMWCQINKTFKWLSPFPKRLILIDNFK